MGAVNAAQLFRQIRTDHPDWQQSLERGDIGFIRTWLHTHIWSRGCELESQELMRAATGKGTDAGELIGHLEGRYLEGAY